MSLEIKDAKVRKTNSITQPKGAGKMNLQGADLMSHKRKAINSNCFYQTGALDAVVNRRQAP